MTDTDWSFSLRSATGFFDEAQSDDDNEENGGDARTSSHLSSRSSQILQQIDLAAREDSAQYKPNPWSIARVNAASRSRQPNVTLKSAPVEPTSKKLPQRAIVDAFKRQAQEPKTTTNSSAQANRPQIPSQKPASASTIGASGGPVSASILSPTSIAHITTSVVDPVLIPSQLEIPQQHQRTPLPSFLHEKAFPVSHSSQPTNQSSNLQFTPSLKRVQPFSSPVRPPPLPQHCISTIPKPRATPPQPPAYFEPHILKTHTPTDSKAHIVTDHLAPTASAYREGGRVVHPSHSNCHPTPVKPERKIIPPPPRQDIQLLSRSRSNQPITGIPPKSEIIPPSPSFAQAHRFFGYDPPPVATIKQLLQKSEPPPKEEPRPSPSPVIASPPRKYIDPYDQLLSSPDSEWSTLKPPARKGAAVNSKGKLKVSDVKSGKFRLPLSMGTITPSKEPPQKKQRVVTYLPPPPPRKQKGVAEPPLVTRDAGSSTGMDVILRLFSVSHSLSLALSI